MASVAGPTPVPAAMPAAMVRTPIPRIFLVSEAVDARRPAAAAAFNWIF